MDILNDLLDMNNPPRMDDTVKDKILYTCAFCSKASYNPKVLSKHWEGCRDRKSLDLKMEKEQLNKIEWNGHCGWHLKYLSDCGRVYLGMSFNDILPHCDTVEEANEIIDAAGGIEKLTLKTIFQKAEKAI